MNTVGENCIIFFKENSKFLKDGDLSQNPNVSFWNNGNNYFCWECSWSNSWAKKLEKAV